MMHLKENSILTTLLYFKLLQIPYISSVYPLIPNFLLPPESSSHHNHDLSHIPSSLASHLEVVTTELENMHIHVLTGEGSNHSTAISHMPHPLEKK